MQCSVLQSIAPDNVLWPDSPQYEHDQSGYWSLQQTLIRPHCRVLPDSAVSILDTLGVALSLNTSVAIVSGGHSSNAGASNIERGLTIDLAALNTVHVSKDQQSVYLGPSARWSDVYAALEPHGLTVAGGRVGHVGVGGYVLGGGFSWHANREGWACDSVTDLQVVTPNEEILWVNSTSHADLFWALKGSLGAFGIVTGIRMKTIPMMGFYGGAISYREESLPAVFAALKEMANNAETDLATTGYLSFGYQGKTEEWTYNAYLINTANSSAAPAIGNFLMIPNKGHTLRHTTPRESADEIAASNPLGFRRSKLTLTILPNMEAMQLIHGFVQSFAADLQLKDDDIMGVTYQPLTVPHLQKQNNVFEQVLSAKYGPLLLVSVDLWWKDASKDALYEKEFRALYEDGIAFGLSWMLVLHAWLYPNYAASWQEPFSEWRLGGHTMRRLKDVKAMYDPEGVWERTVPGIWHV